MHARGENVLAMKTCPYCHNPVYDSARRCAFCGRNLDIELAKKLEKEKADRERFYNALKFTFLFFLFIVVGTVAALWLAIYSPIGTQASQAATQTAAVLDFCHPNKVSLAADQLIDFNDRWADIMALAVSVDRDALVLQVDRLQKIRRDAKAVETPACLQEAKTSLVDGMGSHIDGLLAYIRGSTVEEVNNYISLGNLEMNYFADEVERLQKCAPNCR